MKLKIRDFDASTSELMECDAIAISICKDCENDPIDTLRLLGNIEYIMDNYEVESVAPETVFRKDK